jgi:hypothetical protein
VVDCGSVLWRISGTSGGSTLEFDGKVMNLDLEMELLFLGIFEAQKMVGSTWFIDFESFLFQEKYFPS